MKIRSIVVENFKQFSSLKVTCRESNILVGPNNSGKSTILDALRISHDVLRHNFRIKPHRETFEGDVCASHDLAHSAIKIPIENIARNYSEKQAKIRVKIENGSELVILLHPEKTIKSHLKAEDSAENTTQWYKKQFPLKLVSVPTLGPFEESEKFLTDKTISASENTRTAHRHIRNILY